ncbi:MAG: P-II family nitrogen regulator [Deltaproteobacteria bacterium]|nr:P-II family nitrogen regulator [Deltaproteobacteria bacterium]
MKKIEAIIRPEKLDDVKEALKKIDYPGMSTVRIEGHGQQKGKIEQFRGREFKVEFLPKVKIEVVVNDQAVDEIVTAVIEAARTGEIGDGKIFISDVVNTIRIRTGEEGDKAIG